MLSLAVRTRQGAVSELDELCASDCSADDFIDGLERFATRSRAVAHPLLSAIAHGQFVDLAGAIRRLLTEYYYYSHRFTRYLAAATASLEKPEHRSALVGNSAEEAGHMDAEHIADLRAAGIDPRDAAAPHPELFRRFLVAVGLDRTEMLDRTPHLATVAWVDTMEELYRHAPQEQAIGALGIATEGIVRPMYQKLLAGIARAWPDLTAADRIFFDLHAAVDDQHAGVLRGIAVALAANPAARRRVASGVLRAISARVQFFDEMLVYLRRTDAPAAAPGPRLLQGQSGSAAFADVNKNRNSLVPVPAQPPGPACLHSAVSAGATTSFSAERGHPVFPVRLPSRSVSMSIGTLDPGRATSSHRHAYESLVYVTKGRGYTIMEGQRFEWKAGDALYTPPWCWHQHFADEDGDVEYLTATNMPMLNAMGQTVVREEEDPSAR